MAALLAALPTRSSDVPDAAALAAGAVEHRGTGGLSYGPAAVGISSYPATIDLSLSPAALELHGDSRELGDAIAAGDLNGDGIDDLIVGRTSGAVHVIFGKPGLSGVLQLPFAQPVAADLTVKGPQETELGTAVTTADLNVDGISDLVMGAPGVTRSGKFHVGAVYVVFGSSNLSGTIDLSATAAGISVLGDIPATGSFGDSLGTSVDSGDINGDSFPDLVMGGSFNDFAWIVYGGPSLTTTYDLDLVPADVRIGMFGGGAVKAGNLNGDAYDDIVMPQGIFFGSAALPPTIGANSRNVSLTLPFGNFDPSLNVVVADVNGDNLDDLVVGDALFSSFSGRAYILFGLATWPATVNLASAANVRLDGEEPDDKAGWSLAVGEVTGDGVTDIIVGAPGASTAWGSHVGKTYVIRGGPALAGDLGLGTAASRTITGRSQTNFSGLGEAVAVGDFDADGIGDLGIGAPSTVASFVVSGGSGAGDLELAGSAADVTIKAGGSFPGEGLATGDINGDVIDDVIIGAPYSDNSTGQVQVVYGSTSHPPGVSAVVGSAAHVIKGVTPGELFGTSVGAADLNADGYDDIISGAPLAAQAGQTHAGRVDVFFGGPGLNAFIDRATTPASVSIFGVNDSWLGGQVSSGDVNADGLDDLVAGAEFEDAPGGGIGNGAVHIFFGGSFPATIDLSVTPGDATIRGENVSFLGRYLAVGDVSGDQLDDVVTNSQTYFPSLTFAVFHGSAQLGGLLAILTR